MTLPVKTCSLCQRKQEIICFNTNRKTRDGLHAWCKTCCRRAEKQRYEIVKKEKLKQVRAWQEKNAEKVKGYKKNWRTKTEPEEKT